MTNKTAKELIQRLVEDLESWMENCDCLPESDLLCEARLYLSLQELDQGEIKPPSLKEQALELLDKAEDPSWDINDFSVVRRALEQLHDPE